MQTSEVGKATAEVLEVLAAKFGTTVEALWTILVRQAYVDGFLALFWVTVSAIVVGNAVYRFPRTMDNLKKARFEDEGPYIAQAFMWGAAFVIFIIVGGVNIDTAAVSLGNPEYAALREVLQVINPTH